MRASPTVKVALVCIAALLFGGCELIAGILEVGFWAGVITVLVIVFLIFLLIRLIR